MARFRDTLLRLLGSSSGETILKAAATASGTLTLPAVTDTVAVLGTAQTFTAAQSFNSGDLKLNGATSGAITVNAAVVAGTNTITLPAGTTDFSATGGTSQVVKQTSAGGPFTVARLAHADLSDYTPPTAYTPTITAQTGTFTTVSGGITYFVLGGFLYFNLSIVITANGTAGTAVLGTLPIAVGGGGTTTCFGRENTNTGNAIAGVAQGTNIYIVTYNNLYPGGTGNTMTLSGFYPI